MSWKCDLCDSYNEESALRCCVCDHPRSAESIREAKLRAREEKIERISQKVYRMTYGISRPVFLAGFAVAMIPVVIAIIFKLVNAQLDDVWHALALMALRARERLSDAFVGNSPAVFWHIVSNLKIFSVFALEIIPNAAKNNLINGYINRARPMAANIPANLTVLRSEAAEATTRIEEAVSLLRQELVELYDRAAWHFQ